MGKVIGQRIFWGKISSNLKNYGFSQQYIQNHLVIVYQHPRNVSKKFREISHPEPKILNSLVNCLHTHTRTDTQTPIMKNSMILIILGPQECLLPRLSKSILSSIGNLQVWIFGFTGCSLWSFSLKKVITWN